MKRIPILLFLLSLMQPSYSQQIEIESNTYDSFGLFIKVSDDEAIYFFRQASSHNTLHPPSGKIVAQKYTYSENTWSTRWTVFNDPYFDDRNLSGGLNSTGDKIILNFCQIKKVSGVIHFSFMKSIQSTDLSGTSWSSPTIIFDNTVNKELIPIYEYQKLSNNDHIYTAKTDQALTDSLGYVYVGQRFYGFKTAKDGSVPLYEHWNPSLQSHIYSIGTNPINHQNTGYERKGIVCYVFPEPVENGFPVYHFLDDEKGMSGFSFFKNDPNLHDQGFKNTGLAFYAFAKFDHVGSFGKSVITNQGDIIVGWYAKNRDSKNYCNTMRSTDNGQNWTFFDGKINEGINFYCEANLNYLGPDTIVSVMRNNNLPYMAGVSLSVDDGQTWTAPTLSNIYGSNHILPYTFYDDATNKIYCCALDRGSKAFTCYSTEKQQILKRPRNCWHEEAFIDYFEMNGYASAVKFADSVIMFIYAKEVSPTSCDLFSFKIHTKSPSGVSDELQKR
ncbi:MAG: glycoside hydrolase [Bacteroidales bacterium]|nr:glycoside hydrolase [Bacteroidales bacterium]MCF8458447.1 glycoside hydrolase [Bacteroidales bacterium]